MNKKAARASLFFPFDAVKGLQQALRKKEKIIVDKKILSKDDIEILSRKLVQIKKGMILTIIYYHNQEYIQLEGIVTNINTALRIITIVDTKINFEDILEITGQEICINEYD